MIVLTGKDPFLSLTWFYFAVEGLELSYCNNRTVVAESPSAQGFFMEMETEDLVIHYKRLPSYHLALHSQQCELQFPLFLLTFRESWVVSPQIMLIYNFLSPRPL